MSARRIPSLDGLRAISIGMVLLSHLDGTQNFRSPQAIYWATDLGGLGVRFFFVISGFLITKLLLAEHAKYGKISLTRFYFRRTFRIFPAFYAFLLAIFAAEMLGWITLRPRDLLHSATYTMNYHWNHAWYLGHTWSLAVEEQFYLIWPACLVLLGTRRGMWAAVAVVLAAPAIRVGTWVFLPAMRPGIGVSFETVADALAAGCLLAALQNSLDEHPKLAWLRQIAQKASFGLLPIIVMIFAYTEGYISVSYTVGNTIMNVSIALIIWRCVTYYEGRVGRLLNGRAISYFGQLSYSLYLWQQPFINRKSKALICAFPLNITATVAASLLSYYLVERPFLNLRARIENCFSPRQPLAPATAGPRTTNAVRTS